MDAFQVVSALHTPPAQATAWALLTVVVSSAFLLEPQPATETTTKRAPTAVSSVLRGVFGMTQPNRRTAGLASSERDEPRHRERNVEGRPRDGRRVRPARSALHGLAAAARGGGRRPAPAAR